MPTTLTQTINNLKTKLTTLTQKTKTNQNIIHHLTTTWNPKNPHNPYHKQKPTN